MTTKRWMIGTLATALTLVASSPAHAGDGDPTPVLVTEDDVSETPDLVCEICAIIAKKGGTTTTSSSTTVTLVHDEAFEGDVEMVVFLDSGETTSVWLDGVIITEGELDVEVAPGEGWSWSEVRFAWARYHSTP
ncbi:MAG: hypothetical protein KC501_40415 [Myxococcales bacterium]|nr:hypothetical protein [Myxococcales bacterium]